MTPAFDPIAIIRSLDDHDVECVLVGGLAAVLHGSPATTNDADIMPELSETNLTRLATALRWLEARLRVASEPCGVEFDPHPALLASMKVLNTTTRFGDLDITIASAELDDYADVRSRAIEYDVDGLSVWVASLDDVIRSKEAADRPKDHATLPILYALRDEIRRSRG
jgi:hypothetical protein